jgi:anaerobic selenocysteine-containing dehydrogenase
MNCPVYYTVRDGTVTDVEAVPMEEGGIGNLCPRGMASIQFEYSPTRLLYPLKRVGKRGEGKWERISWDQACKEVAEKIYLMSKTYGPETFVLPGRTGRQDMGWIACRVARTIGTPNNYYGVTQLCLIPQFHEEVQYGNYLTQKCSTDPNTALFVSFGFEFTTYADPILGKFQTLARRQGMKCIALDPVCGVNPSKADLWLPVRPGTDLAYCLCVINYLIKTNQYDAAFMKEWTNVAFLVNPENGALLTERDTREGGSDKRYLFWDTKSGSPKYWDAEEVQWESGLSGRAHYDACVERWRSKKGSTELSPARLPQDVDPALFGAYEVTLKDGTVVTAQPAFQQLADSVKEWDIERTEAVTGIPADRIEASCQMIATIKPVEIHSGVQYMSTNTSQFLMAVTVLKTMTGCIDVPGGNSFVQFYPVEPSAFPGEWDISYNEGLDPEMKRKRLGYYEHPIGCGAFHDEYWINWLPQRPENADALCNIPDIGAVLRAAETGDPYPVHGIIAISSNWLMHDPGTPRWLRLLEDEEKIQLHVVTEMVMTPTAEMADYVFPAATWMERNYLEFGVAGATPFKNFYRKAVEPRGEAKQDYYFGARLAYELEKLDPRYNNDCLLNPETSFYFAGERGKLWENDDIDEERDRLCRMFLGKDLDTCLNERKVFVPDYEPGAQHQRYLVAGRFPTDTGKINVFSTVHGRFGFSPLPVYTEPLESPISRPDLAKDYPLVLSTGKRQPGYFHSEFRQLPLMRQLSPTPEAMMNSETAAEYGLKDGDWAWVETPPTNGRELGPHRVMGRVSCRVMMRPGMVTYSQHAWWRPEKSATDDLHGALEWNAEVLLDCETCAPETGTLGVRSLLCRVYKCSEEDMESYRPNITRKELEALDPQNDMAHVPVSAVASAPSNGREN